jgi:hypothetical protein
MATVTFTMSGVHSTSAFDAEAAKQVVGLFARSQVGSRKHGYGPESADPTATGAAGVIVVSNVPVSTAAFNAGIAAELCRLYRAAGEAFFHEYVGPADVTCAVS